MITKNLTVSLALIAVLLISACQPIIAPTAPAPTPPDQTGQPTPDGNVVNDKTGVLSSEKNPITETTVSEEDLKHLAEAENLFMLDLYKKVAEGDENIIFSPYSLFQALMLAYVGSDGTTAEQIAELLRLPLEDDFNHLAMNNLDQWLTRADVESPAEQKFVFNSANAIWGQYNFAFQQTYLDQLAQYYAVGLHAVDFAKSEEARSAINDWVAEKTENKITELIPEGVIDEATRIVLTNAVYFKAAWWDQFKSENTIVDNFYLVDGSSKQVEMMNTENQFNYYLDTDFTVVEIPYEGGKFSMLVVMPKDGAFKELESQLNLIQLEEMIQSMNRGKVQLSLPKFKFESSLDLGQMLVELGMTDAFNPNLADFSKITGSRDLVISQVLQKAVIEVDEEGTEAAAATAVIGVVTSAPMEEDPQVIRVDHPFMFLIRDNQTSTTLFMGRVVNP